MNKLAITSAAVALFAAPVLAQTPPAAQSGPGNNAANSPNTNNSAKPVEGANSFTEGQAKSRIEAAGFGNVSGLTQDDKGVWRGKAQKDGQPVSVSLDFQGNIIANAN